MRFALVIGHERAKQGAASPRTGLTEWHYNRSLVAVVAGLLQQAGHDPVMVAREAAGSYSKLPGYVNALDADLVVSFHLNSNANHSAHGSEVLYAHGSRKGAPLAEVLLDAIVGALGTRRRRTIGLKAVDRGATLLLKTAPPAVLLEPGFVSNEADEDKLTRLKQGYAEAVATALIDWAAVA